MIDAAPALARKQYEEQYSWRPSEQVIRLIEETILGKDFAHL